MFYGLLYAFTISKDLTGAEIMFSSKQHIIKRLKSISNKRAKCKILSTIESKLTK